MSVNVGWTYKFTFTNDFVDLDGVYSVVKIYTYDELINDGIDLVDGLYTKVGKTGDDLELDVHLYRDEDIYKLVNPDNIEIVYYVPAPILANTPNPNIKKYPKLVIGINLGIYNDETELNYIKDTLHELLASTLGLVDPPKVFSVNNVWLTEEEYDNIVEIRKSTATDVVNYFSENIKLRNTISKQNSTIEYLQSVIQNLNQCHCDNQQEYPA